jgi:hypothetical protein
MARAEWLAERQGELLPVPYFQVVFTLPQQIGGLALQNAREIYNILFRAASETLLTIAADPNRLDAAIGFLAVLHTWGAEPSCSSTSPLRRARRRHWTGWRKLGRLPEAVILSSRAGIGMPVQECLPPLFEEGLSRRQAVLPRRDGRSSEAGRV